MRNNRTLKANCLKLRPRWMWRERESIGDIPLHALMIPGSHNAGAYKITDVSREHKHQTLEKKKTPPPPPHGHGQRQPGRGIASQIPNPQLMSCLYVGSL